MLNDLRLSVRTLRRAPLSSLAAICTLAIAIGASAAVCSVNFFFRSWQREARSFGSLAAMGSTNWSLILREGEPATLPVAAVSGEFFPTLGAPAAMGRTLLPTDDVQGTARVAVMSHGTWERRFGADPDIVGRPIPFEEDRGGASRRSSTAADHGSCDPTGFAAASSSRKWVWQSYSWCVPAWLGAASRIF
jgi:putative ABC transport system permease protein